MLQEFFMFSDEKKQFVCENSVLLKTKTANRLLPHIGVARIFDWGAQITCNDVIKNFERGIFCGAEIS